MDFIDQKVINPRRGRKREDNGSTVGDHPRETSIGMLTSLKWGRVTCPSRWTLKWGGSPSGGPCLIRGPKSRPPWGSCHGSLS
jgi:hypothetical protein